MLKRAARIRVAFFFNLSMGPSSQFQIEAVGKSDCGGFRLTAKRNSTEGDRGYFGNSVYLFCTSVK